MPAPMGLELELDTTGDARVGAVLYGNVTVVRDTRATAPPPEPVALAIELDQIVHGPGGSTTTTIHREILLEGGSLPDGRYPFRLRLPAGPLSWHGRQMTLAWTVRALAQRGDERIAAERSLDLRGAIADPNAPDAATVEAWSLDPLLASLTTHPELHGMALAEAARDLPDVIAGLLEASGEFRDHGWTLRWTPESIELADPEGAPVLPSCAGYALQLRLGRQLVVREVFGRAVEATHRLVVTAGVPGARPVWLVCPDVRDDRIVAGLPYMPVHAHGGSPLLTLALLVRLVLVVRAAGGRLERWNSELEMVPVELTAALPVAPRHGALGALRDADDRRTALLAWPEAVRVGVHEVAAQLEQARAALSTEAPAVGASVLQKFLSVWRARRTPRIDQITAAPELTIEHSPTWLALGESFACLLALGPRPAAVPGYWRLELVEACTVDGEARIARRVYDDGPVEWRRGADGSRRVVIASRVPVRAPASAFGTDWRMSWCVALYVERDGEDVLFHEHELIVLPLCCS